ncbi:MAG: hypothetical protein ABI981_13965 [Betaproteobacteria bacterium]
MTTRVAGDAFIAVAGLAVIGCASVPATLDGPRVRSGIAIAPYALASECMALSRGDRVGYEFAARAPVDFIVSFREGNTQVIPVESKSTAAESGDFVAQESRVYCLTWEAGAQGSMLEYRVQPVRPRR